MEANNELPTGKWMEIMAAMVAVMMALVMCGCCRRTVEYIVVSDSVRTEVRTVEVVVHDTVDVALPQDSVVVATPDTVSRVETSVAVSEAELRGGLLWHRIWNKKSVAVGVDHKETVRDSIVYREKPVPYPVEKEVEKKLSWWQQLRLWLGNILLIAIVAAAGMWGVKRWMRGN